MEVDSSSNLSSFLSFTAPFSRTDRREFCNQNREEQEESRGAACGGSTLNMCAHWEQQTKNNYSAANAACIPLKPLRAGQSQHCSVALTLFCHAALLALPSASPPLSLPHNHSLGVTLQSRQITSSTAFLQASPPICGNGSNLGITFTFEKKPLAQQQAQQTDINIYVHRFRKSHKCDHADWNTQQAKFSLKKCRNPWFDTRRC